MFNMQKLSRTLWVWFDQICLMALAVQTTTPSHDCHHIVMHRNMCHHLFSAESRSLHSGKKRRLLCEITKAAVTLAENCDYAVRSRLRKCVFGAFDESITSAQIHSGNLMSTKKTFM